jgi:hypothetical protein
LKKGNEYGFIQILNLRFQDLAMVIDEDGTVTSSNMADIEEVLVQNIWKRDSKYMEPET